MASRVCAKLLLNATLRRERCMISALCRLSARPYTVLSRNVPLLFSNTWPEPTQLQYYCTDTTPTEHVEPDSTVPNCVCKLGGLPYEATKTDIETLLKKANVVAEEVYFSTNFNGRSSGLAYVVLNSREDMEAVIALDREYVGRRYVTIQECDSSELLERLDPDHSKVVRMGGLPYAARREDIRDFFSGLEILPGGIKIILDRELRPVGIAYINFSTLDMADKAMARDKSMIGDRYVRISKWTSIPPGGANSRNKEGLQ